VPLDSVGTAMVNLAGPAGGAGGDGSRW